jgi:hypothetical protein
MHAPSVKTFGLSVRVDLFVPAKSVDRLGGGGGWPAVMIGYYQNFGVTAISEDQARACVARAVSDGEVLWDDSEISEVVVSELPLAILDRARDWESPGIWYESGKSFFPGE